MSDFKYNLRCIKRKWNNNDKVARRIKFKQSWSRSLNILGCNLGAQIITKVHLFDGKNYNLIAGRNLCLKYNYYCTKNPCFNYYDKWDLRLWVQNNLLCIEFNKIITLVHMIKIVFF